MNGTSAVTKDHGSSSSFTTALCFAFPGIMVIAGLKQHTLLALTSHNCSYLLAPVEHLHDNAAETALDFHDICKHIVLHVECCKECSEGSH